MNGEIFLSASVPSPARAGGRYFATANPLLIRLAVRELVRAVLGRKKLVWGGHPAITPMVWAICEDLGLDYGEWVILYQSRFFEELYPEENKEFKNVIFVDAAAGKDEVESRENSLKVMREAMLSRPGLDAGVFIGGMDGVEIEFEVLRRWHPTAGVVPVAATGGAARELAQKIGGFDLDDTNFHALFEKTLFTVKPEHSYS
jgi:SLOG cluster3 family